jgi:hypothetical protein
MSLQNILSAYNRACNLLQPGVTMTHSATQVHDRRPVGSDIVADRSPEGLILTVPEEHRGEALIAILLGLVCSSVSICGGVGTALTDPTSLPWPAYGGLAIFAILGVALVVAGMLKGGQRETVLSVAGNTLFFKGKNAFGATDLRWAREQIADINVEHLDTGETRFWALQVVPFPGEGKTCLLLHDRDEAELRWVATLLRRELGYPDSGPEKPALPPFRERREQPAGSKIAVAETDECLTLTLPPIGLGHRTPLSYFGVAAYFAFVGAVVGGGFYDGTGEVPELIWVVLGIFAIIGTVVLGLVTEGLRLAWRRGVLTVSADRLLISQVGPFGSQQGQWSRSELADVLVGPPTGNPDERPPWALRIYPKQGQPTGFFAGREAAELQWLATVVRQRLHLPDDSPASTPADG